MHSNIVRYKWLLMCISGFLQAYLTTVSFLLEKVLSTSNM